MALLNTVDAQFRTQWDVHDMRDEHLTKFLINVGVSVLSNEMVGMLLGYRQWRGIRYMDENGKIKIGYGVGDSNLEQGLTEIESYGLLVSDFRNKQRIVRAQLPVLALPQSVYDALVSLYIDTGSWRVVHASEGTYDISSAISNTNWLLAADMLMRGNINPDLRKAEARVLYLGQYVFTKDRQLLVTEGSQFIRKRYVSNTLDNFERKQAEFVYYRQLGIFLPTMSENKQRRVVAESINVTDGRDTGGYVDFYGNATGQTPPTTTI